MILWTVTYSPGGRLDSPGAPYAAAAWYRLPNAGRRWLREHQREGVRFIFECLMGLKEFDGCGCILADDMGLGKTLQSITILWTLLEQGIDVVPGKPTDA